MVEVNVFPFTSASKSDIRNLTHDNIRIGESWPVVYIINDEEEAYVGQTTNILNRTSQHLDNPNKNYLTEIKIISDTDFNVSVVLDLESYLIQHMGADKNYKLINANHGIRDHNYYDRERYERAFRDIWDKLLSLGVVKHTIHDIENSEVYKYSPYKSLGEEQKDVERRIIKTLAEDKYKTVIVRGGAGTGKTILAVYLMKLLADINNEPIVFEEKDYYDFTPEFIYAAEHIAGIERIGIVIPQKPLRASLQDVFKKVGGLDVDMVLDPNTAIQNYIDTKKKYDLLIIDEGHRLKTRKNGGNFNLGDNLKFKTWADYFNLDLQTASELDMLMKISKRQIIFRDDRQTVKASDMSAEHFKSAVSKHGKPIEYELSVQWRCKGGKEYIDYVREIMTCKAEEFLEVENYEFKLYDDVNRMIKDIKELDKTHKLCRTAAGYAWEWKTKGMATIPKGVFDIEIDSHKYIWNNAKHTVWVSSPNAVNEIGCIHTVQGFDLNYLGVIIGEDIKYDKEKGCIYAVAENYKDPLGRTGLTKDPEKLKDYLVNIYTTLMTRGIEGTYVYVCDPDLREYMSQFIEKA